MAAATAVSSRHDTSQHCKRNYIPSNDDNWRVQTLYIVLT